MECFGWKKLAPVCLIRSGDAGLKPGWGGHNAQVTLSLAGLEIVQIHQHQIVDTVVKSRIDTEIEESHGMAGL